MVGEVDNRGCDGWMASPTQWTWVWVNSRSWWWTGKPGMLQSMGLQRVGHDWVAELTVSTDPDPTIAFSYICFITHLPVCPAISSSVIPFSSCAQSFPASGSFQMSQLFASGGQSIGVSTSTSVLPMNIHDWFPLGWTGWISLQSKGLSRTFSNTTVQKHQFCSTQLSLYSNSHIHTGLLEKP